MTSDHRATSGFIIDVLDALGHHGYRHGDHQHLGHAVGLIGGLARSCEGTQDHPVSAHLITVPSSLPAGPGPSGQDAATHLPGCPDRSREAARPAGVSPPGPGCPEPARDREAGQ